MTQSPVEQAIEALQDIHETASNGPASCAEERLHAIAEDAAAALTRLREEGEWQTGTPPLDGGMIDVRFTQTMKYTHYRPGSRQLKYKKGRWQEVGEYGGWDNSSIDPANFEWKPKPRGKDD